MLSLSFASLKNFDQAIVYSEKALEIWWNEELWKVENALLLEKTGDLKAAFIKWEKLLQETESIQKVIFPYLDVLIRNGRSDDVLRLLDQHKNELNQAFEYYFYTAMAYFIGEKFDLLCNQFRKQRISIRKILMFRLLKEKFTYQ